MKRKIIIIGSLLIVCFAAFGMIKYFNKKGPQIDFTVEKVKKSDISSTVTATGTIEAITTVEVGTQVSGIIQHVYVDFNDIVHEGQLLAKLDETSLKAQLDQSQSSVDQAQAQLNFQEATYLRLKPLYDKKLIAKADFDQAVFNFENAKAALNNSKSSLARAQVNLDYATITSPIDGVVLNRAVEEGQTVAASFNTPTLFTIVNDLTQMEVQTSVDEADIGNVKQGQRVEFTVDAYSDLKFSGEVSQVRLQPVTTNNVVTYVVILSAPNPDKKLMPGMTASATIYVEESKSTLILPAKAFRFMPSESVLKQIAQKTMGTFAQENNGAAAFNQTNLPPKVQFPNAANMKVSKMIWIKDSVRILKPIQVSIGIDNGSNIEILDGLNEGDEVIVSVSDPLKSPTASSTSALPPGPFPF